MPFKPFKFLYFVLKRRLLRKAGVAVLLLCLPFITAEIKGAGNGLLEKLKIPVPPTAQENQAAAVPDGTQPAAQPSQPETAEDIEAKQDVEQPEAEEKHPHPDYAKSLETLNFHEGEFDWRKDWWKWLILTIGALVAATFLMKIARQLIRYIVMAACLAVGSLGAHYFGPPLAPWLESKLPSFLVDIIPAFYLSYLLMFLVCYVLATIVLFILRGPLDLMDKNNRASSKEK